MDFLGLPLPLLGVTAVSSSESDNPLTGTVVVVVRSLRRFTGRRIGDVRSTCLCPFSVSEFPASTVTLIFWGESWFPTSSSNVCFVGELPSRRRECLALEARRGFAGDWYVAESLRGSGEDMTESIVR